MDRMYSLCITYQLRSKPEKYMFFRVADFDPEEQKLIPINDHFNGNAGEYNVKIVGSSPSDIKPNLTMIRSWEIDYNTSQTRSYEYNQHEIFEVIFPEEFQNIDYNNTEMIRGIFHNGFSMDETACENLLIVIGRAGNHYSALYAQKKKLKKKNHKFHFSSNNSDMVHTVHYLDEYDLVESEIISTEAASIMMVDGAKAPIRYFYRSIELPVSIGRLNLFKLEAYVPQYIARFLKKNKSLSAFTSAEIKRISDLINTILSDEKYASDYFSATGFSLDDLHRKLPEYSFHLNQGLGEMENDEIVRNYILRSEEIRSQCIEVVREQWLSQFDAQRNELIEKIKKLRTVSEDYKGKAEKEEVLYYKYNEESKMLAELINVQKEKHESLCKDIETELTAFSDNIVRNTALCTVIKQVFTDVIGNDNSLYVKGRFIKCDNVEKTLTHKDDIEDSIAENLTSVGYLEQYAAQISQFITYCISVRIPIIVSENGDEIADCVSALFGGRGSVSISIPLGYTSIQGLIEAINTAQEKGKTVFYITGLFEGMSQGLYNGLIEYINDSKKPIVAFLSIDEISTSLLPKSTWNRALFLDGNIGLKYNKVKILKGYSSVELDSSDYAEVAVEDKLKELKPFSSFISYRALIGYAKLMVNNNSKLNDDWILLLQLCIYALSAGEKEKLSEALSSSSVDTASIVGISRYV